MTEFRGGFRVEGAPFSRGRLANKTSMKLQETHQVQPNEVPQVNMKKVTEDIIKAVKEAILAEVPATEISQGIENLPFGKVKNLAYLQNLETFLAAQLLAVRKEIKKVKEQEDA